MSQRNILLFLDGSRKNIKRIKTIFSKLNDHCSLCVFRLYRNKWKCSQLVFLHVTLVFHNRPFCQIIWQIFTQGRAKKFRQNCSQCGLIPGPPDLQANALPTPIVKNSTAMSQINNPELGERGGSPILAYLGYPSSPVPQKRPRMGKRTGIRGYQSMGTNQPLQERTRDPGRTDICKNITFTYPSECGL